MTPDSERSSVDQLLNAGLTARQSGNLGEARALFERAVAADPGSAPALVNLAGILRIQGFSAQALSACQRALELDPRFAAAHCNLGLTLNELDRPADALASLDEALSLDPGFAAAHGNRGKALHALGRIEDALIAYARLLAIEPHSAQAKLNAAHSELYLGRLERGWSLFEARRQLSPDRPIAQPEWRGGALNGQRLLLHWEQGLGDTIQFCRYAPLLQQRGEKILLAVQPKLRALVRSLGRDIEIVEAGTPAFDLHCPLLSVPLAVHTRLDSVPAPVPYLHAEAERERRWRERIGRHGFRIGITWQGNAQSPADRGRSFPVSLLAPLGQLPGVRLISLQLGTGSEQLQSLPSGMRVETLGNDFDRGPDAFLDSAAVIESLDLLITSDTAIAHLAGALNRPAWLLLQHVADWRWMHARADSPWYPSLRLYRQPRRGDFTAAIQQVYGDLRVLLAKE